MAGDDRMEALGSRMEMQTNLGEPNVQGGRPALDWLHVSRASMRHALWLIGPLALQVILFKALKFAVLNEEVLSALPFAGTTKGLLLEYLAAPLSTLAVASIVALILKRLGVPWSIATFAFAVTFGVFAYWTKAVMRYDLFWLSTDYFEVVRFDIAELLGLTGVTLLCLEHTRGWLRKISLVGLHGLVPVLMMFGILEIGYFLKTGSIGDAFMLRYTFTNLSDLSYVLSSELTGIKLVLLLLPILFTPLPFLADRMSRPTYSAKRRLGIPLVVAPVLLLIFLPHTSVSEQAKPVSAGTYGGLVGGLINKPIWETEVIEGVATGSTPLFDTQSLRAVPTPSSTPMNVVLIVLESQRSGPHMPEGVTPFLDSLASVGTVTDEMYAVIPHTNKALVPILCGIYPSIDQGDQPEVPGTCLPTLLGQLGYRSAFFTPATLTFERKGDMLKSIGFDEAFGDAEYDKKGFTRIGYFGHEDHIMLAPSLDWLDQRLDAGTPFFLTYLTLASHHPYSSPDPSDPGHVAVGNNDYNSYLNAVSYVDGFVGELFGAFESRGIINNTLFLLVSDHGEAFGEHKLQFHSAVPYDEVLHVPTILFNPVRFPEPGHIVGGRQHTDLLPTIFDVLGLELTGGTLPGSSLLEPVPADRRLYHATWIENQSMVLRVGSKKFVYHYRRKPMEVYDLAGDPNEHRDLAGEYPPEEVRAVEVELLLWRRRVNERYR